MQPQTATAKSRTINGGQSGRRSSNPSRKSPVQKQVKGPRIRSLGNLLNDDTIQPRQQLCGPWLLERGFSMVFAPTGVGKSLFALGIAAAVAGGGTFGHWKAPAPRRVLLIDGEMDPSDLRGRFQLIVDAATGGDKQKVIGNIHVYARHDQPVGDTSFPDFGNEEHERRILERIRSVRPNLVVLDNLSTLATVDDANASEAWDPFLKMLHRIRETGAAVLVIHHANKGGENYHGSSKIPVMFDSLVRLKPHDSIGGTGGASFKLDFTKLRMQSPDAGQVFTVKFECGTWRWDTLVDPDVADLVRRILDGEFGRQKDAATTLGISSVEVTRMLNKAYDAGIVTREQIRNALQNARDDDEGETSDF
ncbi:AAA family ATPase [Hyphomicrobium sp.]|uniref:AAA family ATPase n=1 Tax=Hyphomicrobium sp. TaxID=82 RepID=UPI000FB628C0|nr:AAA family ATPase [Hyphomicrobium sp.]RUP08607.1 MAG: AAA family ATPase [Hyphomicrobium sp.]